MYHNTFRLTICGVLPALVLAACSSLSSTSPTPTPTATPQQPQPATIEEITFQSGEFTLVGDLRLPEGTGPFPVVLFVHGSGPLDRTFNGYYLPIMERMLQAGYAVFSWDKPDTGESTGQLRDARVLHQQAQIVLDAIEVMQERPDIDPGRIGLWGISQAGYVMPLVLSQSEDVAFMICVSCPGMSGRDQGTYQNMALALCAGTVEGQAERRQELLAALDAARTYETYEQYLHYREAIDALFSTAPQAPRGYGSEIVPEDAWQQNDPEQEAWWNPIEVLEQVRIPVLAIFGDRDSNGDPIQAAYAWRKALEQAGNRNFRVELYPGVDHFMVASESRCLNEQEEKFDQVLQEQGYGPLEESLALFQREPGQHTPLSVWPYAPGYLDLIEEWLRGLRP